MSDCAEGGTTSDTVAESWEEAGDEVSARLEQRQKQLLAKKQREEELAKAREAQQLQAQQSGAGSSSEHPTFKILRRPPSSEKLSSDGSCGKEDEKSKVLTYQEKEAAYMEARERIFGGKYNPEEMPPLQMDYGPMNSPVPLNQPTPRAVHVPRPRLPASLRVPRMPFVQPTLIMPGMPCVLPQLGSYYGAQLQQGLPMLGMMQPSAMNPIPFYDATIPPPIPPQFRAQNPMSNAVYGDVVARNPVPYGRPPAQLLAQDPSFSALSDSGNNAE